jgi:hypothetical protein
VAGLPWSLRRLFANPASKRPLFLPGFCLGARRRQNRTGAPAPLRTRLRRFFADADEPAFEAAIFAGSKPKETKMSNDTTKTRPTHRIYAVTKQGEKKFWQPIGALWAHNDGKGFNQRLDYLPLNDAQIVIRTIGEEPEA